MKVIKLKLHIDNQNFEGSLPTNRIAMKIKSSAKMFGILSDGIYKDKILAVVREYVCNAYDAHVTVGKQDVPFTVRLPNYLDSTFAVIDEGTGVDPAMIGEIFWTYGESSKTNDVNTIGALGLGSKSAFAYTKSSFIVKNRYQGTEYTYFCFINENGEPEGSLVGEAVSEEATGITVEFAIRPADCGAFYERFGRIFKYWANVKPNILGAEAKDVFFKDPIKVVEGDNWYLEGGNSSPDSAIAIMGNVTYPIESASIPNLPASLKIIADNPFIITFPLGDLEFAASRESLSYTEFSCSQIIKRLEEVRAELATSFHEKVFLASKDHVSFYQAFATTFAEFRKVVQIDAYSGAIEDQFAMLLMSKSQDDDIEFLGTTFSIKDLISGRYATYISDYQSFGLYSAGTRGRVTSRYSLEPCTFMSAKLNEEVDSNEFYEGYRSNYKMVVGTTIISSFDWRAKHVSSRTTVLSMTDKAILSSKVDFETINRLKINTKNKISFILNDVGSSGRDRFKHIAMSHAGGVLQMIFVDFNPKINKLEDVLVELNALIDSSLTGANIQHLSDLPDARPTIDKVKVDKESIKLRSFILEPKRLVDYDVGGSDASINVKMVELASAGVKESVLLMTALKSKSEVLYIIKRRSNNKYFDDVGSGMEPLSSNIRTMSYAGHLGFFDNAHSDQEYTVKVINDVDNSESLEFRTRKVLQILVLNEGQHAHLLKKGVKLVSISSLVSVKIKAIEEVEKFTNSIRRFVVLSKVNHLKGMMEGLKTDGKLDLILGWENSTSLYKSLMNEYIQWKLDIQQHALVFVKAAVLSAVTKSNYNGDAAGHDESAKITDKLNTQYPMIEMITYNSMYRSDKGKKIITYIEQIDFLIDNAVKSAISEVNENEFKVEEVLV